MIFYGKRTNNQDFYLSVVTDIQTAVLFYLNILRIAGRGCEGDVVATKNLI